MKAVPSFILRLTLFLGLFFHPAPFLAAAPPVSTKGPGAGGHLPGQPWRIHARRLILYHRTGIVLGQGGVQITRGKVSINADCVIFDQDRGKVRAYGSVVIHLDQDVLSGEMGELDLNSYTGTISNAHLFLRRNNVHLLADEIRKTGPEQYKALHAVVSTCAPPVQAWSFRCRTLDLTVDGNAVARHATFNVRSLPVLYTPWIAVPVNRYRKTGLLLPYYAATTRNGTELIVPFFWAINDSMDATFFQHPIQKRGWMEGVEVRYLLSGETKGIFHYNFLSDSLEDHDYNGDGYVRDNRKRWWLRGKADHELPLGMKARVDLDMVSDRDYMQEFDQGPLSFFGSNRALKRWFGRSLSDRTDVIRPSTVQVTRLFPERFLAAEARYNDNLLPGEQDNTVQTAPRLAIYGFKQRLGRTGFFYDYNASYTHYWREEGTREHRLHLEPRLSRPLRLGRWADLVLSGSLQETFYAASGSDGGEGVASTSNRLLGLFQADMSTSAARTYNEGGETEFRHVLRPRLTYEYRPDKGQEDLPDIDEMDRLGPLNRVTWSLLSYVSSRRRLESGALGYSDVLRFRMEQTYDFRKDEEKWSDLYAELEYRPAPRCYLRYDTTYNLYGQGFTTHNLWARAATLRGDGINLSYRYNGPDDINQVNMSLNAALTRSLFLLYGTNRSFRTHTEISSFYGARYRASCWSVVGKFTRNQVENKFVFFVELLGIGGWGNME